MGAVVLKVISELLEPVVPVVVKFAPTFIEPPKVIVFEFELATPVPPFIGLMIPVIWLPPIELPDTSLKVAKVPDVGNVNTVVPVVLSVIEEALETFIPEVTKFPPSVIVLPVLSTPVPPLAAGKIPDTAEAEILLIAVVTYSVLAMVLSLDG